MSQEMNMNEKKTPLKQFDADEMQIGDQLGGMKLSQEPATYGTFDAKPITATTTTTTTTPDSDKPSVLEKVKGVFSSNKDAKDSEPSDQNKPGVLQGAKDNFWHGVEKAKGVFSSKPQELHPGNGYHWRKVTEQGRTRWVARDDWSGDSANRGGFFEGAKSWAAGVFSSKDAKESELTESKQEVVAEEQKPGVLQGAKETVWHGVEKAKGLFHSTTPIEQHPGNGYTWKKVQGEQGRFRWVATNDWSTKTGVLQGAKEKVLQGVEKAKGVFSSKSTDTNEQHPGKGYKWKKVEGHKGEEAHWKPKTGFQSLTGTH
jgi:hypothetical protein